MNEIVIFVGIPASGKTSFYKERFFPSHVYVSQDQLRTSSAAEIPIFTSRDADGFWRQFA